MSNNLSSPSSPRLEKITLRKAPAMTRVMSVTSGKGGVGKTNTVINLAIGLARQGKSVMVLDADLSLANVDVLLGLKIKHTLFDLFEGNKSLDEVIVQGPEGIGIIPATSGVEAICNLSVQQRVLLMQEVEKVAHHYDYLLIDTPAGIGPDVMYFNSASAEIVCVISEEPTSLTDAYALIKVLNQNYGEKNFTILSNNVRTPAAGERAFKRLAKATEQFLHIRLDYLGSVPSDAALRDAVQEQRAVIDLYPSSSAGLAYANLAAKIDRMQLGARVKGGMQFFFSRLLEAGTAY